MDSLKLIQSGLDSDRSGNAMGMCCIGLVFAITDVSMHGLV